MKNVKWVVTGEVADWDNDDGSHSSADVSNSQLAAWLAAGNAPDPAVPAPAADPLDAWDIVSLKIAFNHENRIRVLEGKAAVTVAQFKTAVRAML